VTAALVHANIYLQNALARSYVMSAAGQVVANTVKEHPPAKWRCGSRFFVVPSAMHPGCVTLYNLQHRRFVVNGSGGYVKMSSEGPANNVGGLSGARDAARYLWRFVPVDRYVAVQSVFDNGYLTFEKGAFYGHNVRVKLAFTQASYFVPSYGPFAIRRDRGPLPFDAENEYYVNRYRRRRAYDSNNPNPTAPASSSGGDTSVGSGYGDTGSGGSGGVVVVWVPSDGGLDGGYDGGDFLSAPGGTAGVGGGGEDDERPFAFLSFFLKKCSRVRAFLQTAGVGGVTARAATVVAAGGMAVEVRLRRVGV
jgi:hypothetical protein